MAKGVESEAQKAMLLACGCDYLQGYLTHLRKLEQAGKIKIHEVVRTHIGSKFIEGYTAIAWSPNAGLR